MEQAVQGEAAGARDLVEASSGVARRAGGLLHGWKAALLPLCAGLALGGLGAVQLILARDSFNLLGVLTTTLPDYTLGMLMSVPAYAVARRYPIRRGGYLSGVLAAIAVAAAGFVLLAALRAFVLLYRDSGTGELVELSFTQALTQSTLIRTLVILLGVASAHAYYYLEAALAEQRRRVDLQNVVTDYELRMLRQQLQPHFLFNTLQSISTLMMTDVAGAQRMLRQLGDLLRHALEHNGLSEVTLEEELEVLQLYLGIEQIRLGERLRLEIDAPAELGGALVPQMILQPLVENAIRHGIAKREHAGTLAITARAEPGRLLLAIENQVAPERGPRFDPAGFGIRNTRMRLERLYGEDASLQIAPTAHGTVRAVIGLPYRSRRVAPA